MLLPGTNHEVQVFSLDNPLQPTMKNKTPSNEYFLSICARKSFYFQYRRQSSSKKMSNVPNHSVLAIANTYDRNANYLNYQHEAESGMHLEPSMNFSVALDERSNPEPRFDYVVEEEKSNDNTERSQSHQPEQIINLHSIESSDQPAAAVQQSEVSDAELGRIYELYIELYLATFLFGVILLGIFMQVIHFSILFVFLMLIQLRSLRHKMRKLKSTPKSEKLVRRQGMLAGIEIILAIIFQVHLIATRPPI